MNLRRHLSVTLATNAPVEHLPELLDALDDNDLDSDRTLVLRTIPVRRSSADVAALQRMLRQIGHSADARALRRSRRH